MDGGTYILGSAGVIAAVAALAHGGIAVRRALLPAWVGARAALAVVVVALSIGFTVARLAGAVGLLTGPALLVAEVAAGLLAGVAARALAPRHEVAVAGDGAADDGRRPVARAWWEWVPALAAVAVVVTQWAAHTVDALGRGMVHPDTLWYHGPFAARFAQTASLGRLDGVGYEAARWYPLDGQLVHTLGWVAFDRDWLSPLVNMGWLAIALLAAWVIGERIHAGPTALAVAAVAVGVPSVAGTQPGQMSTDIGCAALLLAAVALLLEADLRPVPIALAGAAAGLAVGTKVTALVPVAVLVAIVALLALGKGRGRALWWYVAGVAALGVFWFLRCWVLTGSPLPWFTVPGLFDRVTVEGQAPSLLAARELDRTTWDALYRPGLHQAFGPAWPLVLGLMAAGTAVALRRRRPSVERLVAVLIPVGIVGHLATPLTAGLTFGFNLRYLAPTLLLGSVLAVLALPEGRGARVALSGFALVLVGVGATAEHVERVEAWPDATVPTIGVLLLLAVLGAAATVLVRRRIVPLGGVLLAAVVLAVVAGWPVQRHFEDGRYLDAGLPPSQAIVDALREVQDSRVALFGGLETYPLFGPDLSNEVEIGTAPQTGGSECARWRSFLGDRYDIVVVSRYGPVPVEVPALEVFDGDPAAHLIVRDGERFAYRLDGPLDPAACPV